MEIIRSIGWGPYAPGIYTAIRDGDYDVVYSSTFPSATAFLSLRASNNSGKPFVFTPYFHYAQSWQRNSKLMQYFVKHSDALIACTELEKKALVDIGATGEKVFVIPLSFDISIVPKDLPSQESLKERLGIRDHFVVLTHPWTQKGGTEVLRSISILADKGKKIALISLGKPDREYSSVESSLISKNPKLKILDLGWLQGREKWEAFSTCDVFALPSRSDAFGLSYLNAWALKKPVLAAKGTPAEEIVDDGINGRLVDPRNAEN
ncbi:MAG: glycosyltransferase family 4 protein, partial [Thermoplasmatales archaeon]